MNRVRSLGSCSLVEVVQLQKRIGVCFHLLGACMRLMLLSTLISVPVIDVYSLFTISTLKSQTNTVMAARMKQIPFQYPPSIHNYRKNKGKTQNQNQWPCCSDSFTGQGNGQHRGKHYLLGLDFVGFFFWLGGSNTFLHKVKVKVKDGFKLGEGRERKPPSYMSHLPIWSHITEISIVPT